MIYISEIFYSIQGEGKFCGIPSVFVRVGGCNLRCPGFGEKGCDSYYSVDINYKNEWNFLTIDDIKKEILKYKAFNPHLVITGGEPTLFYEKLYPLVKWFDGEITIETNATIFIDFDKYPKYRDVNFALSVKLSNSGEDKSKRVKKDVIDNYYNNAKKSFFKFVIDDSIDKREIEEIVNGYDLPIYCMPLADTKEKLNKISPFVFNFCLMNGYRYSDRIHIRLFNKKKGV